MAFYFIRALVLNLGKLVFPRTITVEPSMLAFPPLLAARVARAVRPLRDGVTEWWGNRERRDGSTVCNVRYITACKRTGGEN